MAKTVGEVLERKGADVATCLPDADVGSAAAAMNERRIGGLVVVDGDKVLGVFTERDILTKVVSACLDPCEVTVRQVMTSPVVACTRDTPLAACKMVMTEKRIRHLPVIEDGQLVGIVTTGDMIADEVKEYEETIDLLYKYITSW